jgi:hypothetical protein
MASGKDEKKGGIDVQTLLISGAAAVIAATVVPLFWERGTVLATAMTPVIVALASEALRRPAEVAKAGAAKVTRRTTAAINAPTREHVPSRGPGGEHFDPLPPEERVDAPAVSDDDPFGLRSGTSSSRRPWLRIGLITGILAFFGAAAVVTAGELVGGGSVGGHGKRTTFVGGTKGKSTPTPTPTATGTKTATPDASQTATPSASASATATPSAQATETATPSATATAAPQSQSQATATPTP